MKKPVELVKDYEREIAFRLVPFAKIQLGTSRGYLVKGLVPREGLVVIWGPPKCGKTFWAFDLAMHIALGWEYRGRRVERGAVVYVACEGERGLAARAEAFRRGKIAEEGGAEVPFYLLTTRLDLVADAETLIRDIHSQIDGASCAAVVIDTLNRSIRGSESDDADMGAYVKAADLVRDAFGCAVIVIHHCGLDGSRPRGHTSLTGAADAQIAVKRDAAQRVITKLEWMKDGPEGAETVSELAVVEVGEDEDGEPMTSCIVRACDAAAESERRGAKVTGPARVALDLLRKVSTEHGEPAPANNHIPPTARVVEIELWRRYCYEGSISDGDTDSARRKAFGRAATKLQNQNAIGIWSKWVWLSEPPS